MFINKTRIFGRDDDILIEGKFNDVVLAKSHVLSLIFDNEDGHSVKATFYKNKGLWTLACEKPDNILNSLGFLLTRLPASYDYEDCYALGCSDILEVPSSYNVCWISEGVRVDALSR